MGNDRKLRVAIVGLGFGTEFVPIYLDHPDVASVAICDANEARLKKTAEKFAVKKVFTDFNELVKSDDFDAIHLVSGIPDHSRQAVAVLNSGKHCACTVPMATSIADIKDIIEAKRKSGKNYMMMETAVYTRQFFFAKELLEKGDFGRIQFLRGAHYQDMEGWPSYWAGLPPMWYSTHAVGPLLSISGSRATKVHCFGSGMMRDELKKQYGNPFPVETAIFKLEKGDVAAEVTRSLFQCARPYMESFVVYGEKACYEWQMENKPPLLMKADTQTSGRKMKITEESPEPPDRADLLPPSVGKYTKKFVYGKGDKHLSFEQGGGHHGSHPHLVHEFIRSIVEKRKPWIDEIKAADWTAAGICAHESAMSGGKEVVVPKFD